MIRALFSIACLGMFAVTVASQADAKDLPPISVVPHYSHDYDSVTWTWVVPAFDENFDLEYTGRKYLKIGMSGEFIDKQRSLITGKPGYMGYAYTKDTGGFPPVSMIEAVRIAQGIM